MSQIHEFTVGPATRSLIKSWLPHRQRLQAIMRQETDTVSPEPLVKALGEFIDNEHKPEGLRLYRAVVLSASELKEAEHGTI